MNLNLLELPLLQHFFLLLLLLIYGFLLLIIELKHLLSVAHGLGAACFGRSTRLRRFLEFDHLSVIEIVVLGLKVLKKLVLKLLGLLGSSIFVQLSLPLQLILALLITLLQYSYLNLRIDQLNLQLFDLLPNLSQLSFSLAKLLRCFLFHGTNLLLQFLNPFFVVVDIRVVGQFLNLHVHLFQLEVVLQL